jgi:LacI family transcriptional regulator
MLAGLSVATVSRVLNGEAYYSEEAAAKVRTAAAQLGFRVNVLARELRSGAASTTVGLLIGDLASARSACATRWSSRTAVQPATGCAVTTTLSR